MPNRKTKRMTLPSLTKFFVAFMLIIPTVLFAQDDAALEELDAFVMTGSRLSRAEFEGAFSTDLYTAEDIDRTPYQTVNNFLRTVPATYGADNIDDSFVNGGDGRATVGLRGLPTLTLVNGKRTATGDTNLIPMVMVERIEILKEGNGAVYGADAVGGVVNIITKKDFQGFEVTAGYNDTVDGNWGQFNTGMIYGVADAKGHLIAGLNYTKSNSVMSSDRDHITNTSNRSIQATSSIPNPGRLDLPEGPWGSAGSYRVKEGVSAAGSWSDLRPASYGDNEDRFPYALYTPAYRPSERRAFFASFDRELIEEYLTVYGEVIYNDASTQGGLAPAPSIPPWQVDGAEIPADYYWTQQVFGEDAVAINHWRYRFLDLGSRVNDTNMHDLYLSIGAKGKINDKWNWDASWFWNRQTEEDIERNGVNLDNLATMFARSNDDSFEFSGAKSFNPFTNVFDSGVVSNDPAGLDYLRIDLVTRRKYEEELKNISIEGVLGELPAGEITTAFGYEERRAAFQRDPDFAKEFKAGGSGWNGTTAEDWEYVTKSLFAEAIIPVLEGKDWVEKLDLGLAVRKETFSHISAESTVSRIFLRYQMNDEFTFRTSFSEGFTTPSPGDLSDESFESYPNIWMPWINVLDQPNLGVIIQGNPDLQPTESETMNLGLVYTPKGIEGLEVILDYYAVKQSNIITSSAQYYVDALYKDGGIVQDANGLWQVVAGKQFADRITVSPDDGYIATVDPVETLNIASRDLAGLDIELKYRKNTDNFGDFMFRFSGTHILKFDQTLGVTTTSYQGLFTPNDDTGPETVPEFRWFVATDWLATDNLSVNVTWNHVGSYDEDPTGGFNYTSTIDAWDTVDLSANYVFEKTGTSISIGLQNAFDADPPIAQSSFADNYDRSAHNILGRIYTFRVTQSF